MSRPRRIALAVFLLLPVAWGLVQVLPRRRVAPLPAAHSTTVKEAAPAKIAYVGLKRCATCHADEYRSFLKTAHSHALGEVEPNEEPADAQFEHALSGRTYRIYRHNDAFRHREWLTAGNDDGPGQDFPIKYLIGSGRHTRSYLFEDAGFLLESPLTWYESRQSWGLSPGYDRPEHMGFERGAGIRCVGCHVGRAETVGGGLDRVAIHEQTIGCESCHGPGSAHVELRRTKHEAEKSPAGDIVNPARLTRELSEAVCAKCHLRSDAAIFVRGRSMADILPGRRLSEYRIDYRLERPGAQMTVVGHVEQMRMSLCYQRSETMTCTTCHDPHGALPPERARAEIRGKCLECHAPQACGLKLDEREKQQPGDNCLACHMPQVSTDIPHIAFTHHRIGVHAGIEAPAGEDQGSLATLQPLSDVSHLSELEQDRCLGLANLEFALTQKKPGLQHHYIVRAAELLESVKDRGLRDGCVDAGLARIYALRSPQRAVDLALAALNDELLPPSERVNALFVLADNHFRQGRWPAALAALEPLTRLRRNAIDWMLLGFCRMRMGDEPGAIAALSRAAEINPFSSPIHAELAELYQRQGQFDLAERHRRQSRTLADQAKQPAKDR